MKFIKLLALFTFFYSGIGIQAAIKGPDLINARTFTDAGNGQYYTRNGIFYEDQRFDYSTTFTHLYDDQTMVATVAAVAGRPAVKLAEWIRLTTNDPNGHYDAFARSAETYSLEGEPYVIVSVKGGGGVATVKTPKVSVSAADATCSETTGDTCQFLVVFNAPTTKTVKVRYTLEGKATKNKDYTKLPNYAIIPAGNVSGIIEIVPVDDTKAEGPETVKIKLLPQNAYKLKRTSATVQILDND